MLEILHLEDDPFDADLVQEVLAREGLSPTIVRVDTEGGFTTALAQGAFDLILADNVLPTFDGLSALALARAIAPECPFIFVSGTLGEEVAIESLKNGATDYVLKQRLARLGPVVRRALQDADVRRQRRQTDEALKESEERFRLLFQSSPDGILLIDPHDPEGIWPIVDCNETAARMNGYTREELIGRSIDLLNLNPTSAEFRATYLADLRRDVVSYHTGMHRRKDGTQFPVEFTALVLSLAGRELLMGIDRDITARIQAEERRALQTALRADVGIAFAQGDILPHILQQCVDSIVRHLDVAVARIWTLNHAEVLEPQASAGLDDPECRVSAARIVLDRIVAERRPFLTNDVPGDPHLSDVASAGATGIVAFAGYPLLVEDRIVGVMTLFACQSLADDTLEALTSIADIIAQGIERRQAREALQQLNAELEERVRMRTADLASANTELRAEIAERRLAEEAMRKAQAEAEQANRAKSEFLSRMSHELRTPLNAILGFAQLLELGPVDEEQREGVSQILTGGRHLLELINEVLDVARIESGRLQLSLEPVAVPNLLQEIVNLARPLAANRAITMHLALDPARGQYILADRQRISQVFLNLISNAIKYNRDAGLVSVVCELPSEDRLRILVRDTGPGLAPPQVARLFTAFDRLGAERTAVEGTGLGLAISKHLVDAMGGELGVVSEVGKGSTFWVVLPLAKSPQRLQTSQLPGADGAVAPAPERTILCIEDNLSNVRLIERILADQPTWRLLTAMLGQRGLNMVREHRPDLILLDLHLPDVPGDEVLQQLQADPATRGIPVVVLSADAMPKQIERLMAQGARNYLTKPLNVRTFRDVVMSLLAAEKR